MCWVFFFNTTMFDFIPFSPDLKHTVLIYVGDNLMNIKYTTQFACAFCAPILTLKFVRKILTVSGINLTSV